MNSRPWRVIIVDDNEMNRDMLARRLERKGYVIAVAEGARDLEKRVKDEALDLVLLDIEMPEITGLDALQSLRKCYSPTELPIIMVTARDQSEDVVKALNLGANDYLTKPIDFPVALARINTQLSHKKAEAAQRESEERYALAARGSNDGLWDWNLLDNVVYFSPRWKMMLGYQENEIGDSPEEWFSRIHVTDRERVKNEVVAHQEQLTPQFESESRVLHKDGSFRWMLSRGVAVHDASGKALRMAGSQTDITGAKVTDPLTGLPNRLMFLDRLGRLIEHAKRHKDHLFGVLFLDLDGFKIINDSLGHAAGDQVLMEVADRVPKCLRTSDTISRLGSLSTTARLGGDEFSVLLNHIKDPKDAALVAERLIKALTLPFTVDGQEVFTTVSIGIALSSFGYEQPEDILRDADTAMYRAKSLGKARFAEFDADMRASIIARLQLETDLRRAVEREELRNFYQPIVSLDSGRIAGFEALLRWQHPTRGLVPPLEFIPVAEETGMIREIGWWNLETACRQISVWNAHRKTGPLLVMSVNLSAKQFLEPNLVKQIEQLVRELELLPGSLKFEITESTVMVDPAAAVQMLLQIKSLGIQLSIDDFGTGYSSLSYLHRFPFDTLKIDRSFTKMMGEGGESMEIVRTILPMANNLHLNVIAEGVETMEQIAMLRELRCEYAQGYYFSKPVTDIEAGALLEQHQSGSSFDVGKR
jgi:diguanylate cyclase (GGDEF)-like protein/PAS domain S-box-containing protein